MTDRIRIGVSRFGRIGWTVLWAAMTRDDVEIVANEGQGGGQDES